MTTASRTWRLASAALLVLLVSAEGRAHNLGQSYVYLQIRPDAVSGRFEIALADYNRARGLLGTGREITAANLDQRIDELKEYYRQHVAISDAREPLSIDFTTHGFQKARGGYALLSFSLGGLDAVPEVLTFDYSVLFDEEPAHRGFLLVEHNWATGTFANENRFSLIFSPNARRQDFKVTSSGRLQGFLALARLGADHVLLGLDHLFFLIALMLPAVLRRQGRQWQPLDRVGSALWHALTVVTAFAAGHAVAVTLVASGGFRLPDALVETVIAASTTLAAANILVPLFRKGLWWIVFGLSLFHGMGLAGGLMDLGVLDEHFGLSMTAFNLGVEASQALVVLVLLVLLLLASRWKVYRQVLLPAAAVGMILVSGVWIVERAFGVDVAMRERLPRAVQKVLP